MTFPVLGGNSAIGGYAIDNSLRFNDNDSARLTRTPSSSSNRKTFSISCWFKRGNISLGDSIDLYSAGQSSGGIGSFSMHILADDSLRLDANAVVVLNTNRLFRDVSAWYHYLLVVDTTQATASNRFKIYINGVEETSFATDNRSSISQNTDLRWNMNEGHGIGFNFYDTTYYYDGYLAEFHNIDGQALSPTDFGEFDADSGIWKPIEYTGTYGTNGFYLDFENSGSLGADQSGNGNNFTPTNLASTDQMLDTPTNNFATYNPLFNYGNESFSEGNLNLSTGTSGGSIGTIAVNTGKWYWEIRVGNSDSARHAGIAEISTAQTSLFTESVYYRSDAQKTINNVSSSYGVSYTTGDILGVALDVDNQTVTYYKNNSSQGSIDISSVYSIGDYVSFALVQSGGVNNIDFGNFGQDSSFAGNETRQNNSDGNGYGDFYYAPPSGYLALCTQNLATVLSPTIDDGSQYFNTVLYTGTGSSQAITGVGFQPDFTWIKIRNTADAHGLVDSTRGATKHLRSDSTASEFTRATDVSSFDSDGFTVVSDAQFNGSGNTYASWNWKANGGTTSSNTDGSITSTVQTGAGFSIVTFTGDGNDNASVGHGLGVTPEIIIIKNRDLAQGWVVNVNLSSKIRMNLNTTNGDLGDFTYYMGTQTSSNIVFGNNHPAWNGSGNKMVAYVFHSVEGYSKMGLYTGNGNADGTFVYTGFRPAMILLKRTDTTASWFLYDNKRDSYNEANASGLYPNLANAEFSGTSNVWDFTSNGFKGRASTSDTNASGGSYIYMAFAENPFVSSSGVPVVAR